MMQPNIETELYFDCRRAAFARLEMGPDLERCRHSIGDLSVMWRAVDCRTFLGRRAGRVLVAMGQGRFHRVGMFPLCELHRFTA